MRILKIISRAGDKMSKMLGKIIKRHRVLSDLSVKDLAALSGVSYAYCLEIEKGRYGPTIRVLKKITNVLKVPVWQVIKDAEEAEATKKEAANG